MILVVAAHKSGMLTRGTYELVTAARECGLDAPIALLVLGSGVAAVAVEAAKLADQVLVGDLPSLSKCDPQVWSQAVASIATEGEAKLILIAASRWGREYSPRVAVRLNVPLLEDVITLSASALASGYTADRYSYLARATETLVAEAPTAVVTVKPGAYISAEPLAIPGEQFDVELELTPSRVDISEERAEVGSRVSLTEADIVVAGGRGVGDASGFERNVVQLAEALGAAVGATRAVVDAGWRPYTEQVGQTGKTVQPKIYIAVGISGATQHLSGMNKSKLVIAINKDSDAPIFKVADYGLVGDVNRIVPALLAELRR